MAFVPAFFCLMTSCIKHKMDPLEGQNGLRVNIDGCKYVMYSDYPDLSQAVIESYGDGFRFSTVPYIMSEMDEQQYYLKIIVISDSAFTTDKEYFSDKCALQFVDEDGKLPYKEVPLDGEIVFNRIDRKKKLVEASFEMSGQHAVKHGFLRLVTVLADQ